MINKEDGNAMTGTRGTAMAGRRKWQSEQLGVDVSATMSGGAMMGAGYLFGEQKGTGASERVAFPSYRIRVLKAADASAHQSTGASVPPMSLLLQLLPISNTSSFK